MFSFLNTVVDKTHVVDKQALKVQRSRKEKVKEYCEVSEILQILLKTHSALNQNMFAKFNFLSNC